MNIKLIPLIFFSTVFLTSISVAKPVVVEANGSGLTYKDAQTSALIDALHQVTGVHVDHETMNNTFVHSSGDEKGVQVETATQAVLKEKAKGAINSFRVVNKEQDKASGEYTVRLVVEVEKYDVPTTSNNRKSISVQAFDAPVGVCFGKPLDPERLVTSLTDSAQTALSATRKFSVLDRHSDAYEQEKRFINSEDTKLSEQAKLGLLKGSDYILTGKIQNINIVGNHRKLKLSNKTVSSASARADFIFNVMLFANREIQFSSRVHVDLKEGINGLTCDEISDKLAHAAAVEVARQSTLAIFPPTVINVDGDDIHFNYGGNDIHLGDVYKVYTVGKEIIDPYTKESLGRTEKLIGKAKVTDVKAKVSVATMEKEGLGEKIQPGDILRPIAQEEKPKPAQKKKSGIVHKDEW